MTGYTAEQILDILDQIESNLCAECRYSGDGELIDQCRSCAEIDEGDRRFDADRDDQLT